MEVDEDASIMLSQVDLRWIYLKLLLEVSSFYAIELRLYYVIQVLHSRLCRLIFLLNFI